MVAADGERRQPSRSPAHPEGRQHAPAGPLTELGDLLDASGAGDGRSCAHQQDRRQRVPPRAR